MKILNKGFNFSQDGPGNRLVYHTQGCNLRCKWCSNPESMPLSGTKSKDYTVEQIVKEALSCRMMFFEGGGVTFTGGEPTLQHRELLQILKELQKNKIHTAIETNGTDQHLDELLPFIDFLIMDLKQPDAEQHQIWTGMPNTVILQNIKKVLHSKRQLHLRIPLINHVNNDPKWYSGLFEDVTVQNATAEVLPYHEYGKDKWQSPYEIEDGFVRAEDVREIETILKNAGFTIKNT